MSDGLPEFNGSQTANFLTQTRFFVEQMQGLEKRLTDKIDTHAAAETEIHQAFAVHLAAENKSAARWNKARTFVVTHWRDIALVAGAIIGAALGAIGLDDVLHIAGV